MALPDTREYNYASKVQIRSADFNTWQDWIAAQANDVWQIDVAKFVNIENFAFTANLQPQTANASAAAIIPLDVRQGWTITGAAARGSDTGANGSPSVAIAKRVGDGAPTAIGGGTITGFSGISSIQSVSGLSELVATDNSYSLLLQTPGGWTPGVFQVTQLAITVKRASVPAVPAP